MKAQVKRAEAKPCRKPEEKKEISTLQKKEREEHPAEEIKKIEERPGEKVQRQRRKEIQYSER